jgi:hypothetical protein
LALHNRLSARVKERARAKENPGNQIVARGIVAKGKAREVR